VIDLPDDRDRFAKRERIKTGGIQRARRLRTEPTFTEKKLWERLRKLDIRIRRQAPVGAYVVDFACLRAKLVIEVDGGVHNLTEVALRDLARDEWLAGEGFRVLRIQTQRVEDDIDGVMSEIIQAIRLKAPLPLEGEGVGGWGGGTALTGSPEDSELPRRDGVNVSADEHRGSTPTQPSPLQGEGSR
jgi:very-short-patch-repair endonuclease